MCLPLVQGPVLLLSGTADLQVAASRNMSLLQKGLRQFKQPVQTHRLAGINHWFQPAAVQWPIAAGEQQAAFSPQGLNHFRDWLPKYARRAKAPVPVTVRRTAPAPTRIARHPHRQAAAKQ